MSEVKSQTKTPGDHWLKKEEGNFFEKFKIWIQRKIVDEELRETIKKVGWELAHVFPLHVLYRSTIKSKFKDQANEVHAYILLLYPKIYRKLIFDYRVIDLACLYARRNPRPEILHWIKLEDLKKFRLSLMFIEETELKNYVFRYNKVLIFSKESFYDSVAMEENVKLKWNGWETIGKKISFNAALMTIISNDVPLIIITHTPGKHHLFSGSDFGDAEKQHEKEEILTKVYHSAKVKLTEYEKEMDEIKKLATMYAKQASHAKKMANRQKHKDFRAQIDKIDRDKEEQRQQAGQKPNNLKQLIPFLITLAIIIGVIVVLWMFISFQSIPPTPPTPTPPEASSFISNFLNLTKFRGI